MLRRLPSTWLDQGQVQFFNQNQTKLSSTDKTQGEIQAYDSGLKKATMSLEPNDYEAVRDLAALYRVETLLTAGRVAVGNVQIPLKK
ncbi:hypothetical protein BDZ45DRAFT_132239 [Acephala macrosclerotiorum]|nr:hypothetical protein BDZ45DRAFT_132239 [Acephala macrosclerotiorum]